MRRISDIEKSVGFGCRFGIRHIPIR